MAGKLEAVKAKLGSIGMVRKIGTMFLGPTDVFAMDVGSYAVKAAYIKIEGGEPVLKAWGYFPLDVGPESTPEDKKNQVINALRGWMIEKSIPIKEVATSLSGNSVIVRYVKFPLLTKAELWSTLAAEAEPFIPFDINEVQLGFYIMAEITEEGQKKMETVLVAAKKDLVMARLDIIQALGLNPTIIDVDSFALENIFERTLAPKEETGSTLYLNMGHMVTNLSIIENGVTRVVRDVFIAGNTLSKAIMKSLQVDFNKAEELKKTLGVIVDPAEKEKALTEGNREALGVSQAVAGVLKDLVAEVHRSVDFYLSQGPERSIGRIVLTGGTARLKNLSKHLAAELKVPVSVQDPFSFLANPPADLPEEHRPAFAIAVGLALRRNHDWE